MSKEYKDQYLKNWKKKKLARVSIYVSHSLFNLLYVRCVCALIAKESKANQREMLYRDYEAMSLRTW